MGGVGSKVVKRVNSLSEISIVSQPVAHGSALRYGRWYGLENILRGLGGRDRMRCVRLQGF
jgi:hypothetical protein